MTDRYAQERLARAGLAAFFRIARLWQLDEREQQLLLGDPDDATFAAWQAGRSSDVPQALLERISCVLGIYGGLQVLLPEEAAADAWVRRPNTAAPFDGRPALERMLSGDVADLYAVRRYLDAQQR
jgi:hypothetical protein